MCLHEEACALSSVNCETKGGRDLLARQLLMKLLMLIFVLWGVKKGRKDQMRMISLISLEYSYSLKHHLSVAKQFSIVFATSHIKTSQ